MELDEHTVARAQRGDAKAQEIFLQRYAGPLRGLLRRLGSPEADPDDALNDLFVKLLSVLPRFRPDGSATLTTWVFTVAHRSILETRRRRHLDLVELDPEVAAVDPAPGADEQLERRDLALQLEGAIEKLPDTHRRVWVLARVHGQPLEAIAAVEGISVGTVKSRLHRAKAMLVLTLGAQLAPAGQRGELRAAR